MAGILAGVAFVDIVPRFGAFNRQLQAGLAGTNARLSAFGSAMTRRVTLPILAIAGAAAHMAIGFEESLSKIVGLVGIAKDEVDEMGKSVIELSKGVPAGPKELAEALFFVTSAGFRGASAMRVLEASARASAAGLGETKTVADAVTSAVTAYGEQNLSASKATDILVASVREGKLEASELAPVLGKVIPVAAEMGVEFDQVGAAIAAMSRTGLNVREGATAIRSFLVLLLKPAQQARAGLKELGLSAADVAQITEKFDLSLAKGGLSVDKLRKIVTEQGLFEGMTALKTSLGGNTDALGQVIPNVRALTGFLSITGRNAQGNAVIFRNLADATGDADKAFDEAATTAKFKLGAALSSIQGAGIKLGQTLLPAIGKIANVIGKVADGFGAVPEPVRAALLGLLALAAVTGPLIKLWIGLQKIGFALKVVFFNLRVAFGLLKAAFLANPFLIIVAAVVLLGVLIFKFRKEFVAGLKVIGKAVAKVAGPVIQFFKDLPKKVLGFAKKFLPLLVGVLFPPAGIILALIKFREPIIRFFTATLPQKILPAIGRFFLSLPGRILGFIFQGLVTLLVGLVLIGIEIVKALVKGFVAYLKFAIDFFLKLPGRIIGALRAAGQFLFKVGRAIVVGLVRGFIAYVKFVLDFYRKLPGRIVGALKAAGTFLFNVGKAILRAFLRGLKVIWRLVFDFVRRVPGAIFNFFKVLPGKMLDAGKAIFQGLWDGLKAIWKKVVQWFKDQINKLPGFVKKALGIGSPSKVFAKLGQQTMQGYAKGLQTGFKRVERELAAASRLVAGTTFPIAGGGVGARGAGRVARAAAVAGVEGGGGAPVVVHVAGSVIAEADLVTRLREALLATRRRNGAVGLA